MNQTTCFLYNKTKDCDIPASERHETIKRGFSRGLLERANSGSDKIIINSLHKRCNRKYSGISKSPKQTLLIDCKITALAKEPGGFSYKCNVRNKKRKRRREYYRWDRYEVLFECRSCLAPDDSNSVHRPGVQIRTYVWKFRPRYVDCIIPRINHSVLILFRFCYFARRIICNSYLPSACNFSSRRCKNFCIKLLSYLYRSLMS